MNLFVIFQNCATVSKNVKKYDKNCYCTQVQYENALAVVAWKLEFKTMEILSKSRTKTL